MNIDIKQLETELKEVAGNTKVKVRQHKGYRVSVKESDKKVDIYINPKHIRSEGQYQEVRNFCLSCFEV